jgi:hypothetical protein
MYIPNHHSHTNAFITSPILHFPNHSPYLHIVDVLGLELEARLPGLDELDGAPTPEEHGDDHGPRHEDAGDQGDVLPVQLLPGELHFGRPWGRITMHAIESAPLQLYFVSDN